MEYVVIYLYICGVLAMYYAFVAGKTIENNFNLVGVILMSVFFPLTIPIITAIVFFTPKKR